MILEGKKVSEFLRNQLKNKLSLLNEGQRKPGLAVVLVGDNPASKTYVLNKEKACKDVGIHSYTYFLDKDVTQRELILLIETLNKDIKIDGILVQLPLPKHLDEHAILNVISPNKDVDGFTSINQGLLFQKKEGVVAATPKGIMKLLEYYQVNVEGMHACVIGRSQIVGLPIAKLLLDNNATVTICHSKTRNIREMVKQADLIVVAIGKAKFLTSDMVKEGAIVIDVGINRVEGKLLGDVDYEGVKSKAKMITPVPGGVGPMTIYALLDNCYELYLKNEHHT